MADNTYEIIIKNETRKEDKKPVADDTDTSPGKDSTPPSPPSTPPTPGGGGGGGTSTTDDGSNVRGAIGTYFAFKRVIAPIVSQSVEYGISTVSMRTGRIEEQQRQQFAYSTSQRVLGIAESVAIGAAVGSLPGAIIGGLMGIGSSVLNIAYAQQRLNLAENLEDITLGMLNNRAGGSVATTSGSR